MRIARILFKIFDWLPNHLAIEASLLVQNSDENYEIILAYQKLLKSL